MRIGLRSAQLGHVRMSSKPPESGRFRSPSADITMRTNAESRVDSSPSMTYVGVTGASHNPTIASIKPFAASCQLALGVRLPSARARSRSAHMCTIS